jgi:hypothetical protein
MKLRSGCAGFSVFGVQFSENCSRPTAGSICTRSDVVKEWSDVELARRWLMLCPERRDEKRQPLEPTEFEINSIVKNKEKLATVRSRLSNFSWWMRLLSQGDHGG